jgi:2,3-bisphosphoglycerate-independent phosphoglycerate mutase
MILPDHPTPLSVRTHTGEEVPFLIYQKSQPVQGSKNGYNEESAKNSGNYVAEGHQLMNYFLRGRP